MLVVMISKLVEPPVARPIGIHFPILTKEIEKREIT